MAEEDKANGQGETKQVKLSALEEKRKTLLNELDDLLEQVGDDFGPVLLEELQSRLEYIVQNFNDEVVATFKGSFKKWNFTHEQLNELMSSDVKLIKPEEEKVQSEDIDTPSFLKGLDLGEEKQSK